MVLALAGELDEFLLGKLFAMGDLGSSTRCPLPRQPRVRAGLIRYLLPTTDARSNTRGRLLVLANDFTETGVSEGGLGDLTNEIEEFRDRRARVGCRFLGTTGLVGVVAAAGWRSASVFDDGDRVAHLPT